MNRASLAGAVDLSSLRRDGQPTGSGLTSQSPSGDNQTVTVPSLILAANEQNIRDFLQLSNSIPVVVEVFSNSVEGSTALGTKLEAAITAAEGRLILIKIDAEAHPALVDAFGVRDLPSVLALLQGQPAPLFSGDQSVEAIRNVLLRLIQVGEQNNLNATAVVSGAPTAEPELPPLHKTAYEAIEAGNYQLAVQSYERALRENPADKLAQAGLAQARLLARTEQLDFEAVISATVSTDEHAIKKADALVAIGNYQAGFEAILDFYPRAADQKSMVKHLIELFEVVGAEDEQVIAARKKLSLLLF